MGWLSGYSRRVEIAVGSVSGGASNVPMELVVLKGAGSSAAGKIYLSSEVQNWPVDVAITTSDGTTSVPFVRMWYDTDSQRILINL